MINFLGKIERRTFISGLGYTAAGLGLGFHVAFGQAKEGADTGAAMARFEGLGNGLHPNVFIHVGVDGLVSVVCHRSEMGQGIRSSIPALFADELGADLNTIKIIQADGDKAYGDQNTDGSRSIRGAYTKLRRVAAVVRTMLTQAAAREWKADANACVASGGSVRHPASGRSLTFGQLAEAAALLPVPTPDSVTLRPDKELKYVGTDLPFVDGAAYVKGEAIFGGDIRLPNMLIALIARPEVVGGKVKSFDGANALKIPGVKKVIELPAPSAPYMFQPWGGIAVLADNTWAAQNGRDALKITWDDGPNKSYDSAAFRKTLLEAARQPGKPLRVKGDTERVLKSAKKIVDAEYYVPHLPHVPMEPPVAIAHFKSENGGSCEVWAPTQHPQAAKAEVARVLGLSEDKVTVHVTFLGGGFGRKSKADFVSEAAFLSKAAGAPVRVQFTREDDIHNDYLNTVSAQKFTAALDEQGNVTAWRHRTAFPPIASLFNPAADQPAAGDLQQGVLDLALDVPNVLAESCTAKAHVRTGWLRSVYNIFHAFAICSFMDEIAHATGKDPRDVMLDLYGTARIWSLADLGIDALPNYGASLEEHPVDAGRLRNVIERVTKNAGWENRKKNNNGRAYGLAAHRSFLAYVAVVAAVSQEKGKSPRVEEVWISIDAGKIVNTDRVHAQMQGSVISGMNHALFGGVTHKAGAVVESNFDSLPIVRMGEEPKQIHVDLVPSGEVPGGCGEPGVPPVAPAIGNALFALTGKRQRELPFS